MSVAPVLPVEALGDGRYQVVDPNGSGEPHLVRLNPDDAPVCDCADQRYRHTRCKHVIAVEQFLVVTPITLEPIGPGLERDVPPPDFTDELAQFPAPTSTPSIVRPPAANRDSVSARPLISEVPISAPWDEPAEQAVLSAMLLEATAVQQAAELLDESMFYRDAHRLLFRAMQALATGGSAVDPVTLHAALNGDLEKIGGMEYIGALIDVVPTAANVTHHAQIVRDHALRRRVIAVSTAVIHSAHHRRPPAELVQELDALRDVAAPAGVQAYCAADLLEHPELLAPPEAVVPRLGYRDRVTMLAAREKLGKSTLLASGAAALTRGAAFLDGVTVPGDVLWVSADLEAEGDILARIQRFGADPARWHILRPGRPTDLPALTATIERVTPVWVIIDTLANWAAVEDPFSSAEWPRVLLPLRRLAHDHHLAITLPHHATKAEGGGYRDSTAIGANVDLILEMQADGDGPRRKVTARGRWTTTDFTVELGTAGYQLVATGTLSLDAQVLAFVQQHPGCSKNAIRTGLGGAKDDVDRALFQLLERGAVTNRGNGQAHAYHVGSDREPGEEDRAPF